jgi:C-terminal processing protease CtpA/Prc
MTPDRATRSLTAALTLLAALALPAGATTNATPFAGLPALEQTLVAMGLTLDPQATGRAALLAAVQTLDPKARLLTAPEALAEKELRQGLALLPGLRLSTSNGLPVVIDLTPDGPAERAGLATGDTLLGVGTQRWSTIDLPAAQRALTPPEARTLTLHTRRGDTTNQLDLTPALLRHPAIETAERWPNGVGYIKLNGLYEGSGRDVIRQVRAWTETGSDGLVLDLRGAGGADALAASRIAGLFAPAGRFQFAYRDHHQQDLEVFNAPEGNPITLPVMVLIDRHTHGAAEVLAAALQATARSALLLGETSAGDFGLREPVPLAPHLVWMATRILDTADGLRFTGQFGLEPAVEIPPEQRTTHDYDPPADLLDRRETLEIEARDLALRQRLRGDGTLERALDILVGLKSLNKNTDPVSSTIPR